MIIQKISSAGSFRRQTALKNNAAASMPQSNAGQNMLNFPINSYMNVNFNGHSKSNEILILIPLGAPNAGKGTYSKIMSNDIGIPQISTGNLLRNECKNKTELGLEAEYYMNAGRMVPDDVIINMLKNRILEADCRKGFILDGFPRTRTQAEALDEMLKEIPNAKVKVINIIVPENVLYKRSAERMYCSNCGSTYNMHDGLLKGIMKCPDDGNILTKRTDDTPEVLSKRIEQYNSETAPLINYYKSKNLLKNINTGATVEKDVVIIEVMNEIYDKLEE